MYNKEKSHLDYIKRKEYFKIQNHNNYLKNKGKVITKTQLRRKQIADKINNLKESTPCADCGNKFPAVCMDYDHKPGTKINKGHEVSNLITNSKPLERVLEEIKKCELVCANCHRIRTKNRKITKYKESKP